MLTPDEEAGLLAMGNDVARAMHSQWEPGCVAGAFARRPSSLLQFTMQTWVDLDHAHSRLLQGEAPETQGQFAEALAAFGFVGVDLTPPEADVMAEEMIEAVRAGFAMSLKMSPPEGSKPETEDGFGAWLPLLACLVNQCGFSFDDALKCRVGQAFALVAAMRRNQGWQVEGVAYALRDISGGTSGGTE